MKKTYRYLSAIAISSALCLFIALPASAQRGRSGGGGGGGGSHASSGGGGGSRSSSSGSNSSFRPSTSSTNSYRPSSNSYRPANSNTNSYRPSPSYARPSYNSGSSRPATNNSHVAIAPPRVNSQGIRPPVNRVGVSPGYTTGYRGYVNPGTSNVVGTRGYVGQGGREAVGVGGHGFYSPYWRDRGYYYYHHGYFGTYYAPRIGFSIGFLPYGYYSFYYDDYPYFYSDGLFYTYANDEYTVVEPPIGAEVTELPSNAQSIVINGQQYYEANGVYYEPIVKDDGSTSYQVAGKDGELNTNDNSNLPPPPQVGDIVTTLPPDCRKVSLNGEKYYVSPDGYYFQEMRDKDNNKVYKVVGVPDDQPDSDQQGQQ